MAVSDKSSSDLLIKHFWRAKSDSPEVSLRERPTGLSDAEVDGAAPVENGSTATGQYRTYKRRWFGLLQLSLMNIVVSWGWLTYAPVTEKAASYYHVPNSSINWMSTAFLLAFVAIFPLAIAVLNRGPKPAFICAAILLLVGNWVRYAGSTSKEGGRFSCAMAGSIIIGFSQPFVLAAPTRYSDMWFTSKSRVAATALTSLSNPLGAALGQLINPLWANKPEDISKMVLYVSIISTVSCVPALFVPSQPPTVVGPSCEIPKMPLGDSIRTAISSPELWFILIPFSVYVGFFNSLSSLLNQILTPYGFSDDQAGIGGAILIVVGLVCAAISSPILGRNKRFVLFTKIIVPVIAASLLVFLWMPSTHSVAGPYVVLAVLGGACFVLVPVVVELLVELSHPISPEITTTTAWAGGQLFGAIFIIISGALTDGQDGHPPRNMKRALIFQAVVAWAVVPPILILGLFGRKDKMALRRERLDKGGLENDHANNDSNNNNNHNDDDNKNKNNIQEPNQIPAESASPASAIMPL